MEFKINKIELFQSALSISSKIIAQEMPSISWPSLRFLTKNVENTSRQQARKAMTHRKWYPVWTDPKGIATLPARPVEKQHKAGHIHPNNKQHRNEQHLSTAAYRGNKVNNRRGTTVGQETMGGREALMDQAFQLSADRKTSHSQNHTQLFYHTLINFNKILHTMDAWYD